MPCTGRYAENSIQEQRCGKLAVCTITAQHGKRIMAILTKRNQVIGIVIAVLHPQPFSVFRLAVSIFMVDRKARRSTTDLAPISVPLQDFGVSSVPLARTLSALACSASVASGPRSPVIGVRGVDRGTTRRTQPLGLTCNNKMGLGLFCDQVGRMCGFITRAACLAPIFCRSFAATVTQAFSSLFLAPCAGVCCPLCVSSRHVCSPFGDIIHKKVWGVK